MNRRNFIKKGLLYIPTVSIFVPTVLQAASRRRAILAAKRPVGGGGAGYSLISNTAAVGPTTGGIDTTGATLIVVGVSGFAGIGTLSDNNTNSWTALTTISSTNVRGRLYYCENPVVGAGHTFTTDAPTGAIAVAAFSGNAANPFDDESGAGSYGSTQQPGSITPVQADELFMELACWYSSPATVSINGSWSILNQLDWGAGGNVAIALAWKISSAASNPTWTLTEDAYITASQAAFK